MTDCLCPNIVLDDVNKEAEIELDVKGGWKSRSKYNLNDRDWLGMVNEEGTLVPSTYEVNPVFNGVRILDSQTLREIFYKDVRIKSVSFPDLEVINCEYALYRSFGARSYWEEIEGQSFLESVSFPKLTTINGNYAMREVSCSEYLTNANYNNLVSVSGEYACAYLLAHSNIESIVFPKLEYVSGRDAFFCAFAYSKIKHASFPNIKTLNGQSLFDEAFYYATEIEDVSFPELEYVNGTRCLGLTFCSCPKIKTINFPKLKVIGEEGGSSACFYQSICSVGGLEELCFPELEYIYNGGFALGLMWCDDLKTLSFPKLKYIGDSGMENCWGNESLENVYFPELEEVGYMGLESGVGGPNKVVSITFPKLKKLGYGSLANCFLNCSYLRDVSFPSLTAESVSDPDNSSVEPYTGYYFSGMLGGCSDVVVHLPAETEENLCNRPYVLDGFGGTNTTILFDINCCYAQINVVGSDNYKIYVYGVEKPNTFPTSSSEKECVVYDITNSRLYSFMLTGLVVGETTVFNVNLAQCSNINKISTGMAGLNVEFSWIGYPMTVLADGSGGYYFYSNTSGINVDYEIHPTAEKRGATGTITTTNSSQTISVIPEQRQWLALDINHMTENGVLGGEKPAVSASSGTPYYAFDGNMSNSWGTNFDENQWLILYSPDLVKLTTLNFVMSDSEAGFRMKSYVLYGSVDGENYTQIYSQTPNYAQTFTANVNCTTPYKYFKFDIVKSKPGYTSYGMSTKEITCIGTAYR